MTGGDLWSGPEIHIDELIRREIRADARELARDAQAARRVRSLLLDRMVWGDRALAQRAETQRVLREVSLATRAIRRALKFATRMRSLMPSGRRGQMTSLVDRANASLAALEGRVTNADKS